MAGPWRRAERHSRHTYNREVRRLAAVLLMLLFASLNAIDGICCPDGCTHQQEASSDQSSPQPTAGICMLCIGGVDHSAPQSLSPGAFIVAQVVRTATGNPDDVRPEPLDHPPRF
jgi:hypothetical protein